MNNENSVDKVVSYVSQTPSIATATTNATNTSYQTDHRRGAVSTIVNTNECNDDSIQAEISYLRVKEKQLERWFIKGIIIIFTLITIIWFTVIIHLPDTDIMLYENSARIFIVLIFSLMSYTLFNISNDRTNLYYDCLEKN